MLIVRRIFGILYLLAGIAKAFPRFEDVGAELLRAAAANQGTPLADVSQSLACHTLPVAVMVGVAMAAFGYSLLRDRLLVPAAIGQIVMLLCFMAVLHRAYPLIFAIDLPFLIVAVLVLNQEMRASRPGRVARDAGPAVHQNLQ